MFEVTNVRRGPVKDELELTATEEMSGSKDLLIHRGLSLLRCPYRFPKGSKLTLDFPNSKGFEIGDLIEVSAVLEHHTVQKEISGWYSEMSAFDPKQKTRS